MIQQINSHEVGVFVPSCGRPSNVQLLERLLWPLKPTWVVPDDEAGLYRQAGAKHVLGEGSRTSITCVRNVILDKGWQHGVTVLMVDDDLRALGSIAKAGEKRTPIKAHGFFGILIDELQRSPFSLAGPNTTDNAYFVRKAYHTNLFISTACCAVKPTPLRFDERFKVKEDYDYVCQHVRQHSGALRVNRLLPTFTYRTNAGGCQLTRTPEVEEQAIALLTQKWGDWIRRNPRRDHEVLLKIPDPRRAHAAREILT